VESAKHNKALLNTPTAATVPTSQAQEDQETFHKRLCYVILSLGLAHRAIENPDLQEFLVSYLGPVRLPTRREVSAFANSLGMSLREQYHSLFATLLEQPSVVLDLWKAPNNKHYLGVVVVFLHEWKLYHLTLGIIHVKGRHTSENLFGVVTKLLDSFGLAPSAYVTDNARNQLRLSEMLADWSDHQNYLALGTGITAEEEARVSGDPFVEIYSSDDPVQVYSSEDSFQNYIKDVFPSEAYGCLCHSLELVIKSLLKPLDGLLTTLRALAARLRNNSEVRNAICAQGLKVPYIPADVVTRWSSTYRMINSVIQNKDALIEINTRFQPLIPTLSSHEQPVNEVLGYLEAILTSMSILEYVNLILEPISVAVNTLEGSEYPTINLICGYVFFFDRANFKLYCRVDSQDQ